MFLVSRCSARLASGCVKPNICKKTTSILLLKSQRSFHAGLQEKIEVVKPEETSLSLYQPWKIRHLKSESDVQEAQALLHQVYINEMGWMFAKDSPTGFRIDTAPCGRKLLTDDLENHSSWFGVTHEDQIVAVVRRVHRDSAGHLDLTRYESSKKPAIQKLICSSFSPNLAELQRCAVKAPYRGTNALPCLFHYLFVNAALTDCNLIGTSPVGKMKSFMASTLKIPIVDQNFLYSENVQGPSTCFFASSSVIFRVANTLEKVIKSSKSIKHQVTKN